MTKYSESLHVCAQQAAAVVEQQPHSAQAWSDLAETLGPYPTATLYPSMDYPFPEYASVNGKTVSKKYCLQKAVRHAPKDPLDPKQPPMLWIQVGILISNFSENGETMEGFGDIDVFEARRRALLVHHNDGQMWATLAIKLATSKRVSFIETYDTKELITAKVALTKAVARPHHSGHEWLQLSCLLRRCDVPIKDQKVDIPGLGSLDPVQLLIKGIQTLKDKDTLRALSRDVRNPFAHYYENDEAEGDVAACWEALGRYLCDREVLGDTTEFYSTPSVAEAEPEVGKPPRVIIDGEEYDALAAFQKSFSLSRSGQVFVSWQPLVLLMETRSMPSVCLGGSTLSYRDVDLRVRAQRQVTDVDSHWPARLCVDPSRPDAWLDAISYDRPKLEELQTKFPELAVLQGRTCSGEPLTVAECEEIALILSKRSEPKILLASCDRAEAVKTELLATSEDELDPAALKLERDEASAALYDPLEDPKGIYADRPALVVREHLVRRQNTEHLLALSAESEDETLDENTTAAVFMAQHERARGVLTSALATTAMAVVPRAGAVQQRAESHFRFLFTIVSTLLEAGHHGLWPEAFMFTPEILPTPDAAVVFGEHHPQSQTAPSPRTTGRTKGGKKQTAKAAKEPRHTFFEYFVAVLKCTIQSAASVESLLALGSLEHLTRGLLLLMNVKATLSPGAFGIPDSISPSTPYPSLTVGSNTLSLVDVALMAVAPSAAVDSSYKQNILQMLLSLNATWEAEPNPGFLKVKINTNSHGDDGTGSGGYQLVSRKDVLQRLAVVELEMEKAAIENGSSSSAEEGGPSSDDDEEGELDPDDFGGEEEEEEMFEDEEEEEDEDDIDDEEEENEEDNEEGGPEAAEGFAGFGGRAPPPPPTTTNPPAGRRTTKERKRRRGPVISEEGDIEGVPPMPEECKQQ